MPVAFRFGRFYTEIKIRNRQLLVWLSHIGFPCVPQNSLANCENSSTLLLSSDDHFRRQNYFQVLPYPSRAILNWNCCRCQMELWKCLIKMISVTVSENHFSELIWYVCDWRVAISCFEKMTLRTYDFLKKNECILSGSGFTILLIFSFEVSDYFYICM